MKKILNFYIVLYKEIFGGSAENQFNMEIGFKFFFLYWLLYISHCL